MKKAIKIILSILVLIFLSYLIINNINNQYLKNIIKFFNTNLGTATIGFIGVIAGCTITYITNKIYNNRLLKNEIRRNTLDELQPVIINALKESASLMVKEKSILGGIKEFKEKSKHTVNDKITLDETFKDYFISCNNFEDLFSNILIYFDTHQIILSDFINYHQRLSVLLMKIVEIKKKIKNIYSDNIYISLHKINLSSKYIEEIENLELDHLEILEEIQFHLDNLCREIQNNYYSKLFNKKVQICKDSKYEEIRIKKDNKKSIDFSDNNYLDSIIEDND